MTIRNYLFLRTTGTSILVLPVGVYAVVALSQYILVQGWVIAAATLTWLVAWFAVLIWYSRRIRCPRCNEPLGMAALNANGKYRSDRGNACPHCGISFDEQMPPKAAGTP